MGFVLEDRVHENTTTTGTGPFALSGAVTGKKSFGSRMSVNDTCFGTIVGVTEWVTGLFTYSATNQITVTTVYRSSNSDAAVSFSAGTKDVFIDLVAPTAWDATGKAAWLALTGAVAVSGGVEAVTHAASSKSTPVDADEIGLVDSAASNVLKKLTWANLKATFIATALSWGAKQTFVAATTGGASINVPAGTAPTSPATGDLWATAAALFYRISGATRTVMFGENNGSDFASAATTRSNLGVTATGSDTTYNYRANNLSDVASASSARANLLAAPYGVVMPQGRLTLTTATPVLTSNATAQTTIYYTPYTGSYCPIYDGTNMVPTSFSELSQATTDTTKSPAAVAASSVYDMFVWNDSGTIRCTRGPAWTNDTTRSLSLTRVNGVLLNASSITNGPAASRGTYVGTVRSNGSSQIDFNLGGAASGGTAGFIGIWNHYNRCMVQATATDNGGTYNYSTNTIRQARASSGMQVSFVIGVAEDAIEGVAVGGGLSDGPSIGALFGVGYDTTTAFSNVPIQSAVTTVRVRMVAASVHRVIPAAGVHYVAAVENAVGGNSQWNDVSSNQTISYLGRY